MDKFKIVVTSASGLEGITKREILKLNYGEVPSYNGKLAFYGDENAIARCNMFLRTADRVYISISEFEAESFDELYENLIKINWSDYLSKRSQILSLAKSINSTLYSLSAIQSITKKAIIDNLKTYLNVSTFPEDGERCKIMVSITNNIVSVLLDTSGEGLHKRGYRDLVGEAPIKETMAAAVIYLSKWDFTRPFADLFCGSGTIPIEAAMMALRIAPGMNRDFDYKHHKYCNDKTHQLALSEARDNQKLDTKVRISGFDIDKFAIKLSNRHAERLDLCKHIHFQVADMRTFSSRFEGGTIISNPPYGERLLTKSEIVPLYKDFFKVYDEQKDWNLSVITSEENFEKIVNRRADKTRKLFNAKIKCRLYQYIKNNNEKEENNGREQST